LVDFCEQHEIDLAVLTVTNPGARALATDTAARLEQLGTRTLVGQPGSTLTDLQALARDRNSIRTAD
jgi:hypothetical protein